MSLIRNKHAVLGFVCTCRQLGCVDETGNLRRYGGTSAGKITVRFGNKNTSAMDNLRAMRYFT